MSGHTRRVARAPAALTGLDLHDAWPRKTVYVSGDPAHAGAYACR